MRNTNHCWPHRLKASFFIACTVMCLFSSRSLFAQSSDKRFEISGGYSYTRAPKLDEVERVPNGWTGGAGVKIKPWIAIYGEVGFDRVFKKFKPNDPTFLHTRSSYLGGLRLFFNNKSRVTPFVNGGVGYVRFWTTVRNANGTVAISYGNTNVLFVGGGGLDIAINKKGSLSWRNSAEFRRVETGFDDHGDPTNGAAFRYMSGLVFKF